MKKKINQKWNIKWKKSRVFQKYKATGLKSSGIEDRNKMYNIISVLNSCIIENIVEGFENTSNS